MNGTLLLTMTLAALVSGQTCLAQTNVLARDLRYPAHIATNVPNYQDYFILTTNGDYVRTNDPTIFWRHYIWKEMPNGWRVGLYAQTNRPGYVEVVAGSLVTNSGPGFIGPPYGKFAKLQLVSPDGRIMTPRPDAGTNLLTSSNYYWGDSTNVPAWAALTNCSLTVDFPETALATDYPHYPSGWVIGGYAFVKNNVVGICGCKLGDAYSIPKEGDYTLTIQTVLYKSVETNNRPIPFQTNVILHRVDLPSFTTKVHLLPNEK